MMVLLIVLRNLRHHKVRAILSFVAVFLAAVVLHLYIGATETLRSLFDDATVHGTLLVKARYGPAFVSSLPNDYNARILEVPGVAASTPIVEWVGILGATQDDYVHVIGVDPAQFRNVAGLDGSSLPEDVYREFVEDEGAVITSRGARLKYGRFAVGNTFDLPMRPGYSAMQYPGFVAPETPPVLKGRVVGEIAKGLFSDRLILVHAKTLERLGWKRNIGLLVRVAPGAAPDIVGRRIEDRIAQSGGEHVEALLFENWLGGLRILAGQLSSIVLVIVALVGLLAAGILMHGVSTQGFDLLPQIGTLRALALGRAQAALLLAGEGVIVAVSAAVFATALLWWLTSTTTVVDMRLIDPNFAPVFKMSPLGAVWVIGGALAIALAGALVPAVFQTRSAIAELRRMRS